MPIHAADRLTSLLSGPEEEINLAEAALLIAKDEYPALDINAYLHRLDELADGVQTRMPENSGYEEMLIALNEFLFDEQGFAGNKNDYYDPRNSFLNDVLDRKLGIPITLSIVYMEIGRRLGLPLEGVAFPWHFMVKLSTDEGEVVIDPFSDGMALSEEDLVERLKGVQLEEGASLPELARLLVARSASNKQIVLRMLRNLKAIYLQSKVFEKALSVVNRILYIAPDQPDDVRQRAQIYENLECFRAALEDYQRYRTLQPDAPDTGDIHVRMIKLERLVSGIN
jgi:regulator of sirC expression with transglutaminase-like and TPR domain